MNLESWTFAAIGGVTGVLVALGHLLDQIPHLTGKVTKAIKAVRMIAREFDNE
jgi:hypothetical protein